MMPTNFRKEELGQGKPYVFIIFHHQQMIYICTCRDLNHLDHCFWYAVRRKIKQHCPQYKKRYHEYDSYQERGLFDHGMDLLPTPHWENPWSWVLFKEFNFCFFLGKTVISCVDNKINLYVKSKRNSRNFWDI